jgi:hypothetical protein
MPGDARSIAGDTSPDRDRLSARFADDIVTERNTDTSSSQLFRSDCESHAKFADK